MSDWKKVFAIIWSGQLISTLSSMVIGYAIIFWLSIEKGSAEILAYSTIAFLLPHMTLGLFTGVFVDRWNRKRTMIAADLFIALCTLVAAVLLYQGEKKVFYFYILLSLRGAGAAFHIPAMQASIPLLAPEDKLMRIAGVNNIIQSVSTIASPALAALLISIMDMTWVLMIDVAGAIVACFTLLLVHIPDPEKKESQQKNVIREISEGLKEIYRRPGLLWMFVMSILVTFCIMPVSALFPLMTLQHFSGNSYDMSIVEIAWGFGMLAGGAIMGWQALKNYKIIMIILMYILLGLTFFLSGILPPSGFIYFAMVTFFGGIAFSLFSGAFTVLIQTLVDPAALGRVFSMQGSITLLPSLLGLLATGLIAEKIGITNAFIISGSIIIILGIVIFFVPVVGRMVVQEIRRKN